MQQILPVFMFPTTLACVDDNALFLKYLTAQLGKTHPVKVFDSPKACETFFKTYIQPTNTKDFFRHFAESELYHTMDHASVDLNFSKLADLSKKILKTEEISVLIVDFDMPEMNGIELCRCLKEFPMKKILLTGTLELKQAIKALNDNVIDCYINKDNSDLINEIRSYIDILSKNYFIEKTHSLLNHLEIHKKLHLSDEVFVGFFAKWCQENHIKEHYLIDKDGTFLVIDDKGAISYFVVATDNTLEAFLELYDDTEFSEVHEKMKNQALIPFFGPYVDPLQVDTSLWEQHLYEPTILVGKEKYYWAVVQ